MEPEEIQRRITAAYQGVFNRDPQQAGLDYYTGIMQSNPNFRMEQLRQQLQASPEAQLRAAYAQTGREPTIEEIQRFNSSGSSVEDFIRSGGEGIAEIPRNVEDTLARLPEYENGLMTRDDVTRLYQRYFGRDPESEEVIQSAIQSGVGPQEFAQILANSEENRTNPDLYDLGRTVPLDDRADRPSVADLAYNLATGTRLDIPDYRVADYSPDMLNAFELARQQQGVYQPFLDQAEASTFQGIGALGEALTGTRDLAGQIPGQITPGQEALSQAAQDLQQFAASGAGSAEEAALAVSRAAQSSDPATRLAAEELMSSSTRIGELVRDVSGQTGQAADRALFAADQARADGQRVEARLEAQLEQANALAAEAAATGRADLREAAERARAAASDTADRLYGAGAGAQLIASDAASRARALSSPLEAGLAEATSGARGIAAIGQAGADVAAERARMSTAEAQRALQAASGFGLQTAQQGIAGLRGSTAMYTPDMIAPFMSTYEDAAVQQALSDIARQGELQEEQLAAQAIQAGAYGGSRQAVAEQELARNIMEQQGRTAAQMRAQGFESAAARSQDAFERALGRQQQAAQLTGQLGQMGAGAAASAAQSGGQLGLAAEELAQGSALQGAQLGLSAEQFASANQQAIAQTGLSIEQLAAQTGLSAQELAGNFAAQAGQQLLTAEQLASSNAAQAAQLGMSEAQFQAANAQALAQTGMSVAQLSAQTGLSAAELAGQLSVQSGQIGLSAEQQRQSAATSQAQLSQSQAQQEMRGAESAGQLGLQGARIGMEGSAQAGNLGLQGSQLGLSGIQAGLAAQQQASGIGQGIAGLGQYQLGLGQAAQTMGLQDVSTLTQMGQMQMGQRQAELEAQRMNEYQQAMLPYQQVAFASDILGGMPTGITSTMSQPIQTPSMLSQIGGLGIAALSVL